MEAQLEENSTQKLVLHCSTDRRERTNAAFALGAYMVTHRPGERGRARACAHGAGRPLTEGRAGDGDGQVG